MNSRLTELILAINSFHRHEQTLSSLKWNSKHETQCLDLTIKLSGLSDDVLVPLSSLNTGKKIQHIHSLSHLDETPRKSIFFLSSSTMHA
ncbi:hypothetical protein E4U56_007988 [Claviceps arundinis]|uniref:Uncharacterized protein n=1 Tax=Claviceps arundinis TaxID=1623583 RepID=A0A9P7MV83_9HYPO|nr:hypothetical protein E4U56_007988 [Claviceps arundinis]